MTALGGIVWFDGRPADTATAARLIDRVPHRGREARVVSCGPAAFAWRGAANDAAQPGHGQPLLDSFRRCLVVFDGRIDNQADVAEQLAAPRGAGTTSSQLVLAAYERWGADAPLHLLGDFAFAIWDDRRHCLLVARDALGVKPISLARAEGVVAFGSETRQMLAAGWVDDGPNLGFFAECLANSVQSVSETLYRGIERLPPAHVAVADAGGCVVRRYWDIDPGRQVRYADPAEYGRHFREVFAASVGDRLRGIDRAGVLLSGGIDSSAIVGMAAQVRQAAGTPALRAYSQAWRGMAGADEEEYARAVAAFCDVPLTVEPYSPADPDAYLRCTAAAEDTIPGTVGTAERSLLERAAADGCLRLLDGSGGDEWFTGEESHSADLLKSGRLIAVARQVWADAHHPGSLRSTTVAAVSSIWPALPVGLRRVIKALAPAPDRLPPGFSREFAARTQIVDRLRVPQFDARFPTFAGGAAYAAATAAHGVYSLEEDERQAAAHGLELSYPFLDRRVAEFGIALPEEERWSGQLTKRVVRAGVRGLVPDAVLERRAKSGGAPAQLAELRVVHAAGRLSNLSIAAEGFVDQSAVDAMYCAMIDQHARHDSRFEPTASRLWAMFLGECVWRALFDGRPVRSVAEATAHIVVG